MMLRKGDKIIWKAGSKFVADEYALGLIYARVTDIKLVDDPMIRDWKPKWSEFQRIEQVAWKLIRKNWTVITVAPINYPEDGEFFCRGKDIDPMPIEIDGEETVESLIRNEMIEE